MFSTAQRKRFKEKRRSPHGWANKAARVAWWVTWTSFFYPSPRTAFHWRNMLLRLFGAQLQKTAVIYRKAKVWAPWNLIMDEWSTIADDVDVYCVDIIHMKPYALVSQYSYLCGATHDFDDTGFPLVASPIVIGERAWVAANVFVGPGVTVGDGAVIGARSSVYKDVEAWMVNVGNPARPIRKRKIGPEDFAKANM